MQLLLHCSQQSVAHLIGILVTIIIGSFRQKTLLVVKLLACSLDLESERLKPSSWFNMCIQS